MLALEIHFFWDVTLWYWVSYHRRFEECWCFLLRGQGDLKKINVKFGLMKTVILMCIVFLFWWGEGVRLVSAVLMNNLIASCHATDKYLSCTSFVKSPVVIDVLLTAVAACYAYGTALFGRQFTYWNEKIL
jgi:hypothetical protein